MKEKTFSKIMNGYMVVLAVLMLLCMTILLGYHSVAGNLNLFTFAAFSAMWYLSFKFVCWSIADYKSEASNS
ncbi:hypothetical protein EEL50_13445 [Muribaculaceae bacterium Isolate-105 (HZI)]|uniref:hypothetical protein n=1 Tax=uncultured Duncaniella sp. TaxID=2768039 RepID=UPI000F48631C|nr:hypothetical protein [uncultured Duncaniella sp.]ROT11701.1 hypothetical protein EEL50_13445 [Muribaculaceae bacterium Isolate-105 (HZI)]